MAPKRKSPPAEKSKHLKSGITANLEVSEASGVLEHMVIPVVAERLQVGKRQVISGKVAVHKTVEERLETVTLPLQSETVDVKRIPIGEVLSQPTVSRQEGDTLVIPVLEEVLVTEKRFRLIEEIHITTKRTQRDEVQEVMLRREKVRLERNGEEISIEALKAS